MIFPVSSMAWAAAITAFQGVSMEVPTTSVGMPTTSGVMPTASVVGMLTTSVVGMPTTSVVGMPTTSVVGIPRDSKGMPRAPMAFPMESGKVSGGAQGLPTVSVVVPAYNYGHLIKRTIQSVIGQAQLPLELIIVDDGSTDDTRRVVGEYAGKGKEVPVLFLTQENRGPAAARNHGISRASGDYVFLLDADDALLPGALESLLEPVTLDSALDMVVGGCIAVDEKGRKKPKASPKLSTDPSKNFKGYLEKRLSISHGRILVRRSVFERISYPEHLRCGEDLSVFAHLLATCRAVSVDAPISEIYHHDDSLRNDPVHSLAAGLRVVDAVFDKRILSEGQMKFRNRYEAARCLSLFRTLYRAGEYKKAEEFYRRAISTFPAALFRFSYLRKYLLMKCLKGD